MLETFLFYRPDEHYEHHGKKGKSSAPKPEEEDFSSVLAIRLWKPSSGLCGLLRRLWRTLQRPPPRWLQCYRDFGKLILIG